MSQQIQQLLEQCQIETYGVNGELLEIGFDAKKFAQLIVKEMCGLMEQAEDDAYHCFEPADRPTEYIAWLAEWQERFTKHFGVEE
ncbi:hypothetical protein [Haliscomenobacter sp.]|uniref:hypothetical protein n=1 Tax=Haliscomenobacter sp. TaxID=2717303 RepID=UPI0033650FAF